MPMISRCRHYLFFFQVERRDLNPSIYVDRFVLLTLDVIIVQKLIVRLRLLSLINSNIIHDKMKFQINNLTSKKSVQLED